MEKQLFSIKQKHRAVVSSLHKDANEEWSIESHMIDNPYALSKSIKEFNPNDGISEYGVYPVTIIEINNSTSVKYRNHWIFDHDMLNGRIRKVVIVNDDASNGISKIATVSGFAETIEEAMDIIDKRMGMDSLK